MMCLYVYLYLLCFFFFKQKTAYEMRISDWSSDVCSSDLQLIAFSGKALGRNRRRHPLRLGLQPAIEGLCIDKPERVCGLAAIGLEKGREIGHRPTMPPWINRVESRSARHRNAIQVVLVGILDQNRDDVARRMARRVAKQHIAVDLGRVGLRSPGRAAVLVHRVEDHVQRAADLRPKDRKSTRLNSSH